MKKIFSSKKHVSTHFFLVILVVDCSKFCRNNISDIRTSWRKNLNIFWLVWTKTWFFSDFLMTFFIRQNILIFWYCFFYWDFFCKPLKNFKIGWKSIWKKPRIGIPTFSPRKIGKIGGKNVFFFNAFSSKIFKIEWFWCISRGPKIKKTSENYEND